MRLANKVAIITGGSAGIGRASAYMFAKEGAKIVAGDIDDANGKETADNIKADGGEAIFIHTDVTSASEAEHLVKETANRFGKIDILFNNVGIGHVPGPVESIDESVWDMIYAVDVKSVFLMTKYAVPEMKKGGGGVIINTASMSGVRPVANYSVYSSAKGAVITLTKALALELAPDNIRVNSIAPTAVNTVREDPDWEEYKKSLVSIIPLGRVVELEDVAYAALYLASDESSMITGTCINIDGGRGL